MSDPGMERGVRRWVVDISQWNPSEDRFSSLLSLLPPHEHPAVTRFIKAEDRKRAFVSRLLQYSLAHEVVHIPFDKIIMHRTPEGKPYLKNCGEKPLLPNFNFSVSHHGNYVGIASEPVCLVGLDIVSIVIPQNETVNEFIKNFSMYFTTLEWNNINLAGTSEQILAEFYRYWCLKESYVKALGAGIGYGLHRLEFHHTKWTNISVHIDGFKLKDWRFWLFELDKRHLVSVARGHPKGAVESYRRTLAWVDMEEAEFWNELQLPDTGFIFRTVEQLIPVLNWDLA